MRRKWKTYNSPRHIRLSYSKGCRDIGYSQRDGEEVKRVPGPANESHEEHHPLVKVEFAQDGDWVPEFGHRWFQTRRARYNVAAYLAWGAVTRQYW